MGPPGYTSQDGQMDFPWARDMPATRVSMGRIVLHTTALDCMQKRGHNPNRVDEDWRHSRMYVGWPGLCASIMARVPLVPCPPLTAELSRSVSHSRELRYGP